MTHRLIQSETTRRQLLAMATVGGAGVAGLAAAGPARAAGKPVPGNPGGTHDYTLTVIGTTDLHGNVYNWDYFKNAEYDDGKHNDIGLAKAATLIKAIRAEKGAGNTLTLDAGDTIQGTPLAYYYAKVEPITSGTMHPMAAAMNEVGYDAAALGNHEFNYGLDLLRAFEKQCHHPLLSANTVDWNTGAPIFPPYVIKTVKVPGQKPLRVGILGLVTPGVAIWDKANVEGKARFPGIVEQATVFVPRLKAAGADVVVVSCHSGATTSSSYGDALPYPENASTLLAQQVPDIDAILVGHAHVEVNTTVTNQATGRKVLLLEPLYWGMRVAELDIPLTKTRGQWVVDDSALAGTLYNANTVPEDAGVAEIVRSAHQKVLTYVNGVIGSSTQAMSAATSRYEDTAAMDFINRVQAEAVKSALAGTADAATPVLSIAAPFNKDAAIPAGDVTVRDVAGLYIYDNTLLGIRFTGAQVLAYLEYSARYFKQVSGTGPFPAAAVTNAVTPDRAERDARLQLRHHGRPRRAPDLRHRHRPAGRLADHEPAVCGRAGDVRPGLRRRHQQLPPVRRRWLPGCDHGSRRLQPAERDPPDAHRLGGGQQGHRPAVVLHRRLAAGLRAAPRWSSPADVTRNRPGELCVP